MWYRYIRKAHYHETDMMGMIHHSNYLRWMEEARIAFTDDNGISYTGMEAEGITSPIASLSIEYVSPARFGDILEVALCITRYSGAVLEISYEITDSAGHRPVVRASTRQGFIKNGRPVSLKKAMPGWHEKMLSLADIYSGENDKSSD